MVDKKGVSILTLIIVVIVVAIIASVATVRLTGNAIIKVTPQTSGVNVYAASDVYNKTEVDSKFIGRVLLRGLTGGWISTLETDSLGNLLISSGANKAIKLQGNVTIVSLNSSQPGAAGQAYVCVNQKGELYRSMYPCTNVVLCTSYTYSAWSTCYNGIQTRQVLSASPTGCTNTNSITTQTCSTVPMNSTNGCLDTDGGQNLDLFGYASNSTISISDSCVNNLSVAEAYCYYNSVQVNISACSNGKLCYSGKCL